MLRRRWFDFAPAGAVMVVGAIAAGSAPGCAGDGSLKLCGQIPEGGCPIGRGGSCDDAACAALYDCVSGAWTRVEKCAGGGTSSSTGTGAGGTGPVCTPVTIDHTLDAQGCTPELQTPDCPALAAESCTACSGCDDFFQCQLDPTTKAPAWTHVAFCDANGRVVLSSQ